MAAGSYKAINTRHGLKILEKPPRHKKIEITLSILGAAQRRVRESESESERLASEKLSLGMGPAQGL